MLLEVLLVSALPALSSFVSFGFASFSFASLRITGFSFATLSVAGFIFARPALLAVPLLFVVLRVLALVTLAQLAQFVSLAFVGTKTRPTLISWVLLCRL